MRFSNYATALLPAIASVSAFSNTTATNTTKKYVIMDNDWSSAGFIPFLLALDAGWEVLGLTSSTSDSWQYQCALHALATLASGNLTSCIPVIQGATYPLINTSPRFQAWETVHGVLPWEGAFAPYNATAEALGSDPTSDDANAGRFSVNAFVEGFPSADLVKQLNESTQNAAMFMIEQVHKYPGQVSIYAAGALTNIALAVRLDPRFASLAKELVIMGGYIDVNLLQVTGTVLQADLNSDINLMMDPESAKIAFTADFPRIVIAGNVANQIMSTQDFLDEVYEVKTPYSELMYEHYGTEFPFWDETAAILMVDDSTLLNSTTFYIDVDTSYGSPSYGNIHAYQKALAPVAGNLRNVTFVTEVDGDKLKAAIKRSVQQPRTCGTMGKVL